MYKIKNITMNVKYQLGAESKYL